MILTMSRHRMGISLFGAVLLAPPIIGAVSEPSRDSVILARIYSALGGRTSGTSGGMFVMALPGIPVSVEQDSVTQRSLSILLDSIPQPTKILRTLGSVTVSQIYGDMLSRLAIKSDSNGSLASKKAAAANALLFEGAEKSQLYQNYLRYKGEYEKILQFSTGNRQLSMPERQRLQAARQDWIELGQKPKVEQALSDVATSERQNPINRLSRLRARFKQSTRESEKGPYELVETFPASSTWLKPEIWSSLSFDTKIIDTSVLSLQKDIELSGNLWTLSSHAVNRYKIQTSLTKRFTAQVARVSLVRPWMDADLFFRRDWYLDGFAQDDKSISQKLKKDLPLLCSDVLLARNVRIMNVSQSELQTLKSEVRAERQTAWGPFALSGTAFNDPAAKFIQPTFSSGVVSSQNIQVIGWYCENLTTK